MSQEIDENRRTPEELAVLFDLEPDIKEVIVEGRTDAGLLRWYFSITSPDADVKFFAIQDRVLINNDRLQSMGYDSGNRGRVIATAQIVESLFPEQKAGAFVADRDRGAIGLDPCPTVNGLHFTDFTSIELYFFNEKSLRKILTVTLRAPQSVKASHILTAITPILTTLFRIRAVLRTAPEPKPKLAAGVIDKLKIGADGTSNLDPKDALQKSAQGKVDGLLQTYEALSLSPELDVRHYIHGHDFCAVLVRYLQGNHPQVFREERRGLAYPSTLELAVLTSAEVSELAETHLFQDLTEFLRGDED
ncbi:hypothetical protein [Streptomyces griseoluteus]|uniref:hypothetical protein n=1 Tax=Streptomyces griseoluteus TaxID=29306 RepID=UPI0036CB4FAC